MGLRYISFALLALTVVVSAGCGRREQRPIASQVAAKVNSDEITVHQINNVLARMPNVTPEVADHVKREILDQLIDQQLASQRAMQKKLDQVPIVLQALEAAKSEILARAYLEQIAQAQPKPTTEEVKKYYAEHPELFAQRRVFNLEEIVVVANEGDAVDLRELAGKARSMQEIATWLQSRGLKFTANRGVSASEQIPFEVLAGLHNAKDGDIRVIESSDNRRVVRVADSRTEPVDEETAAPRIAQFLFNRRSNEAIAMEMKRIRGQAKIEYVGEFAGGAAGAEAKARTHAEASANALDEVKLKAEADARARSEALSKARAAAEIAARRDAAANAKTSPSKPAQVPQQSMEKGVRGL